MNIIVWLLLPAFAYAAFYLIYSLIKYPFNERLHNKKEKVLYKNSLTEVRYPIFDTSTFDHNYREITLTNKKLYSVALTIFPVFWELEVKSIKNIVCKQALSSRFIKANINYIKIIINNNKKCFIYGKDNLVPFITMLKSLNPLIKVQNEAK
jgi:hypothetical protein